ncbi:hypothetical protein [Synechococcus sp. UW179A]|nr:hypothetical protein [Synechococcus sp. UW179A]
MTAIAQLKNDDVKKNLFSSLSEVVSFVGLSFEPRVGDKSHSAHC